MDNALAPVIPHSIRRSVEFLLNTRAQDLRRTDSLTQMTEYATLFLAGLLLLISLHSVVLVGERNPAFLFCVSICFVTPCLSACFFD